MDNEEKLKTSATVGSLALFVSCYGISFYDQATHDSCTNYQDKLPMETILVSSLVTGIKDFPAFHFEKCGEIFDVYIVCGKIC